MTHSGMDLLAGQTGWNLQSLGSKFTLSKVFVVETFTLLPGLSEILPSENHMFFFVSLAER